jgi:hypothetical protein
MQWSAFDQSTIQGAQTMNQTQHTPDLRKLALSCLATNRSIDAAALDFLATLLGAGITRTPDGCRYSMDYVRSVFFKI